MNQVGALPDGSDRQPVYQHLRSQLQDLIESADYEPGDRIPSERELAARFGASRMTVRRAIEDLIRLGFLERISTKGTFVRRPVVTRRMGGAVMSLSQMLSDAGGDPKSILKRFAVEPASEKAAHRLSVPVGEPLVVTRRIRILNGQPFSIETSSIPRSRVEGLAQADLASPSLFQLLRGKYGLRLEYAEQTVSLSRASPEEAEALGLRVDDPVLLLRAVIYDIDRIPVEYLVSVNHPDHVLFHISTL